MTVIMPAAIVGRTPQPLGTDTLFTLDSGTAPPSLRLLRPAESATRRLIIALARGLVVTLPRPREAPATPRKTEIISTILRNGVGTGIAMPSAIPGSSSSARAGPRALSLPLFDPMQHPFRQRGRKQNGVPRVSLPGFTEPFPVADRRPPAPDDAVDAGRLCRRLEALASALDDLPRQGPCASRAGGRAATPQARKTRNLAMPLARKTNNPSLPAGFVAFGRCGWDARPALVGGLPMRSTRF